MKKTIFFIALLSVFFAINLVSANGNAAGRPFSDILARISMIESELSGIIEVLMPDGKDALLQKIDSLIIKNSQLEDSIGELREENAALKDGLKTVSETASVARQLAESLGGELAKIKEQLEETYDDDFVGSTKAELADLAGRIDDLEKADLRICSNSGIYGLIDAGNDEKNCGGCGIVCPDGFFCENGSCSEQACIPDCANKDCGADGCGEICGTCAAGQTCENYRCENACPAGEIFCGSVCVNPNTSPFHCGGCGKECFYGICSFGICINNIY